VERREEEEKEIPMAKRQLLQTIPSDPRKYSKIRFTTRYETRT